ncbi:MAG: prepilin peptidase [Acidobacteria bacterium]|nr:prepilin peptidase [Acidobacteriota bacterium]MCW5949160.1 prepilin peptidase [Pyrinomonadaceae bacterium]
MPMIFTLIESETGVPDQLILILIFIVGACIGSFLNVVIYRVPNERSLLPSSACPSCGRGIKPWHNVPIVGWLILGGKCANCKSPISWRYPAIELLTAVLFCIVYLQFGLVPYLGVALAFTAAMTALVFIDADHMILPNVITYPLFIAALIVRVVFPAVFDHSFSDMTVAPISYLSGWPSWAVSLAGAIFGALVGGGSLWLIGAIWKALRGVDAMGLGDVKLLLGIGALFGWRLTLLTIFIGAFTGAVGGIAMLSRQKEKDLQAQIPFGIFLGIGSFISMLYGDRIIGWYLSQF